MNIEKTAAIAEIVSSIAIVITLIYLAVQTQQMTEQTKQTNNILLSSSRQVTLEGDLDILKLVADHPDYPQLATISDRALTDIELGELNTVLASMVRIREYAFQQYKAGILDEETWESYLAILTGELRNTQSKKWWEDTRRVLPADFVAEVERRLKVEQ